MYSMKAWRVAEARARFGDLLDEAEGGQTVVIERRGVRFVLEADRPVRSLPASRPLFDRIDKAVQRGEWTWAPASRGVKFRSRRRRS
jgi:antitoxin (DNA-binding transcriptional repressor) of toxin-antitoxin stability system